MEGMFKLKPTRPPECNKSKIPTDVNKGQASNTKKYIGKKPRKNQRPEPKSKTNFQAQCTNL